MATPCAPWRRRRNTPPCGIGRHTCSARNRPRKAAGFWIRRPPGSAQGILTYQPDSPLANAKGYVTYPDVNIGNEMTSLVEAQVSYEVNAKVMQNSSDAYNAVLQIKA